MEQAQDGVVTTGRKDQSFTTIVELVVSVLQPLSAPATRTVAFRIPRVSAQRQNIKPCTVEEFQSSCTAGQGPRNILGCRIHSQTIGHTALMWSSEKLPGMALHHDSAQSPDSFDLNHGAVIGDNT